MRTPLRLGVPLLAAALALPVVSPAAEEPASRRDPFADLRVRPPRPVGHDPARFLVQEIAVRGVVKTQTGWKALILGPDGRSYVVAAGQSFGDGTLTAVDAAGITVRQQLRDPLAPPRVQDVRMELHPER